MPRYLFDDVPAPGTTREVAPGHYSYASIDDTLPQRIRQHEHSAMDEIPVQV